MVGSFSLKGAPIFDVTFIHSFISAYGRRKETDDDACDGDDRIYVVVVVVVAYGGGDGDDASGETVGIIDIHDEDDARRPSGGGV